MKNTVIKILIFALIGCVIALSISVRSCQSKEKERNRLSDNQRALFEDITYYKTEAGLSAASVGKLTLTKKELEAYSADLVKTIEEQGIKIKRLESASKTATETIVEVKTTVRDTVIIRDTIPIPAQAFDWSDWWVSVSGVIAEKEADLKVNSRDTLVQGVHRVPRQFLFIKYGVKGIRQTIVSSNPHTDIVYSEYVEMKK